MNFRWLLLVPMMTLITACGSNSDDQETAVEQEILNDQPTISDTSSVGIGEEPLLEMDKMELEKAYTAFVAKGVPAIPLRQALDFYKDNRESTGGLKDASCLKTPMSETGEIPTNSNRFDPTTKALLKKGIRNERYIVIVDFTDTNTSPRGYILDMVDLTVFKSTVAHGYGSEAVGGIPQVFTNVANKGTTVSGFFVSAVVTYPYYGTTASSGAYNSTGLRLYGLQSTNNTAEATSKVSHGAPYVTEDRAGTSAGCPAWTQANAKKWLPVLKGGVLWYHYTKINKAASYKAPSC
ncbi:MAG: murein L,D-transpeptidase catalytic domain family protein [Bdellovibrionales bacterium]|nr:murein L,D-transpeptidase catalytic domain family protein [Bdellovibrionales bacterium]